MSTLRNAVKSIEEMASERWEDERSARSWAAYAEASNKPNWLEVVSEMSGEEQKRVLDVGTGAGMLALLYAEAGHRVTGLDLSEAMLREARRRCQRSGLSCEFVRGNAEALPFEDRTFDLVTNRIMLWTLPNPGIAVREWVRVLRPGGRVVIFGNHPDLAPRQSSLLEVGMRSMRSLSAARFGRFNGHDDSFWKAWQARARHELPFHHAPAPKVKALLDAAGLAETEVVSIADRIGDVQKKTFRDRITPYHVVLGTKSEERGE